MAKKVSVIPEYRPTVPLNAMCGDKICPCNKAGGHKKQMHIDLCLVKFEKKIYRSDIEYEDNKYRNMWCYKPHPIVAMEFKYYYKFDKWLFDEDIAKLLVMQRVYRTQLLYVCFGTYDRAYVDAALKYIKQRVGQKRSVREKFRLAAGTLDKKDWKILQIK